MRVNWPQTLAANRSSNALSPLTAGGHNTHMYVCCTADNGGPPIQLGSG